MKTMPTISHRALRHGLLAAAVLLLTALRPDPAAAAARVQARVGVSSSVVRAARPAPAPNPPAAQVVVRSESRERIIVLDERVRREADRERCSCGAAHGDRGLHRGHGRRDACRALMTWVPGHFETSRDRLGHRHRVWVTGHWELP